MGLIIKGTFPRVSPFTYETQGELSTAPTRSVISYLSTLAKDATPPVLRKDPTRKHDMGKNGEQQKTTGKIPSDEIIIVYIVFLCCCVFFGLFHYLVSLLKNPVVVYLKCHHMNTIKLQGYFLFMALKDGDISSV